MPGEPMAIEQLCAYYWESKGYVTRVRIPFKTKKGQTSDIDVACFNPKSKRKEGIIISIKAWGSPEQYPTYDHPTNYDISWLRKEIKKSFSKEALSGFKHVFGFYPRKAILYLPAQIKEETKKIWEKTFRKDLHISFEIQGIHELIKGLIVELDRDIYVKRVRYPDPAREFIRWFLRSIKHSAIDLYDIDEIINPKRKTSEDYREDIKTLYVKHILRFIEMKAYKGIGSSLCALKALLKLQGAKKSKFFSANDVYPYARKIKRTIGWGGYNSGLERLYSLGILETKKAPKTKYRIHPSFLNIIKKELRR